MDMESTRRKKLGSKATSLLDMVMPLQSIEFSNIAPMIRADLILTRSDAAYPLNPRGIGEGWFGQRPSRSAPREYLRQEPCKTIQGTEAAVQNNDSSQIEDREQ